MYLLETLGLYFVAKYRVRAEQVGVQVVARQLRKQGVPLEVARVLLASRVLA